jgi:hypothetical protein
MQRSNVSHVWLLLDDALFDVDMVMEASEFGFRLIPYESFAAKNEIIEVITPKYPLEEGVKLAATWLGQRYDFMGLIGMAVVLVGGWFRKKWHNPLQSARAMFCSEALVRVLQGSKWPKSEDLECARIGPEALLKFVKAS